MIASPAPAFQLVSNSKTFYRVEEPRTWKEAMWYCQEHYTDLADLQSVISPVNIMVVYSYTSSTQAWIGLFYDVHISGLSWSSAPSLPPQSGVRCLSSGMASVLLCIHGHGPCPGGCLLHNSEALHLLLWCCQINILGLFFSKTVLGRGKEEKSVCVLGGHP